MSVDLTQAKIDLEAQLTDTVRISRTAGQPVLDPVTGEPGQTPTSVVYEGPGAVLSTHGQIVLQQVLGVDWLSEGSAWYRLVTPVTAPVALLGDLVEVVTETAADRAHHHRVRRHLNLSDGGS
ncbi:DUF6093 family protein [Streptomyces jeddahensis]|uniref:Uncharacterized protein n=1 Tax=Streptomyces jeddahensis TaxID=1716141 RepID=A0A177HU76_9ACTN|nr:DUF6093 family protein [Streptomyces jeddahensis]OAH14276.1 hypothetical protein STSP_23370 [Streptomyces jeddahensis]